jgi:uridine monophosphate synthetase
MTPIPFFERLAARAEALGTLLCPGLDPRVAPGPEAMGALLAHAQRILEATRGLALCYKVNTAFYEVHGADGWRALTEVVALLQAEAPVIVDAKRGDIGATAEAYAAALFDGLGADAVTVSPGLGPEGLAPFLSRPDRGVFALLRTSNPGADCVQEVPLATGLPAWRGQLAWLEALRARHPNLGYVIGATVPAVLSEARGLAATAWFLAPGVGAQGARASETLAVGANAAGHGLVVPVSRGLDGAAEPRAAAEALARDLRPAGDLTRRKESEAAAPPSRGPSGAALAPDDARDTLVARLVAAGCVKFGSFRLKSGLLSPVYLDLRRLVAHPTTLALVAGHYAELLRPLRFDHIAGLPYAALPIGTAVSLATGRPLVYPRRERKGYGTDVAVEGVFSPGDNAVILDDVVTRGDAKLEALVQLRGAGLTVTDMVVLVDREEGAGALLAAEGTRLHSVMTLSELTRRAHGLGLIDDAAREAVQAFVARPRDDAGAA